MQAFILIGFQLISWSACSTNGVDTDAPPKRSNASGADVQIVQAAVHARKVVGNAAFSQQNIAHADVDLTQSDHIASAKPHTQQLSREKLQKELQVPVPKIIHHTYKEDLSRKGAEFPSLVWETAYNSWKRYFPEPEYRYQFWVDKDLRECIRDEFPSFLQEYDSFSSLGNNGIEAADAGRYCILHKHGGIYADLDYEVLKNFYGELPPGKVSLVESPHVEDPEDGEVDDSGIPRATQFQNALMASPANHPFWSAIVESMMAVDPWNPEMHQWNSRHGTGPWMITDEAALHQPFVHVLPCQKFQRLNDTDTKYCGNFADVDGANGIHWGSMSYWIGNEFGGLYDWKQEAFMKLHPEFAGRELRPSREWDKNALGTVVDPPAFQKLASAAEGIVSAIRSVKLLPALADGRRLLSPD